ncbi:MAG: N-acetylmuramoyl-L-alanine amidase [Caldilineaceae bacterium]|nr:N-acetylmuramoyl-L-alanine amidase [Caldilineaceae bacterium]
MSLAAFFAIALIVARILGMDMPWSQAPNAQNLVLQAFNRQVALISGHAGYDSGAVCTDAGDNVLLTEADVNAQVSRQAAELLRAAGADVEIFDEYDPRLENLQAEVLLSIHADSCIDASGYKAAYYTYSAIPQIEQRILDCIDLHYAAVTGLPPHPDTVTHNMTEYHAFRRIAPETPAAILELGFLGGDQALLTAQTERVARGVADSLLCFLRDKTAAPTVTAPGESAGQ